MDERVARLNSGVRSVTNRPPSAVLIYSFIVQCEKSLKMYQKVAKFKKHTV